jgi:monofunctional biosynthetic peptidoglycan transglycosylase
MLKKIATSAFLLSLKLGILICCILLAGLVYFLSLIPSEKQLRGCLTTKMHSVELCPGNKNYIPLNQISSHLKKIVVLTEDSAFYQHTGFDFQELENSLKKNLEKGRFARGGSTISQQLAKNLFLSSEKTLSRKAKEALITIQLERHLTKNEILERYLNVVQFGEKIFGVKAASQYYFQKSPAELSILESSFLALLLPNPRVYSKSYYRKKLTPFAEDRMKQILEKAVRFNRISQSEYQDSLYQLPYFLTGSEAPVRDDLDLLNEEKAAEEEVSDEFENF